MYFQNNMEGGYIKDNNLEGGARGGARKRMYKSKHCSPGENDIEGSCLDDNIIIKVANALNNMKNKKIDKINTNQSIEDIHGDVCKEISKISSCSSEACWQTIKSLMKNLGSAKKDFKESFKPLMPDSWIKDYNEWMSTFEIEDCLEQHTINDKNFYFYGAVPIDFKKCSVSNLCSFNMKKHLDRGETKIGIVFNTDPSTKSGEHWISMYLDLGKHNGPEYGIYYFDSYGYKPNKEIKDLIKKIMKQADKLNNKLLYFYNDNSYQKKNAQCGMYSIHFIKQMLEGVSFEEYLNSKINDKLMIQLREEYFVRL